MPKGHTTFELRLRFLRGHRLQIWFGTKALEHEINFSVAINFLNNHKFLMFRTLPSSSQAFAWSPSAISSSEPALNTQPCENLQMTPISHNNALSPSPEETQKLIFPNIAIQPAFSAAGGGTPSWHSGSESDLKAESSETLSRWLIKPKF